MGDDWCRMRLRENADPIEVKRLIDDQALAFRQGHDGLLDDLLTVNQDRLQTLEQRKEARQRYIDTSRILIGLLHIRAFDETYQYQPGDKAECMRMSFIGRNDIFPAEWRLAAYRTVLPEEVETRLSEWERYIKAVREGGYRGYLLEWYLYTESHKAEQFWQELQLAINQMRQRTNAWAQRLLSTELPDQIAMLPTLTTYPPPRWSNWLDNTLVVHYQTDERYQKLQQTLNEMHRLRWEWNRGVPKSHKLSTKYTPFVSRTFEQYLNIAGGVDELFNWLRECVTDRVGLYLWA